jgi:hypothetical protein
MSQPILKNLTVLIITGLTLLVGFFAALVVAFFQDMRQGATADAVRMISYSAASLYQVNPQATAADLEEEIRTLHTASITAVMLDAQRKPVDAYGTPFRVRHLASGKSHTAIATSAGPDRRFDTEDDITHEQAWEVEPPAKP